MIIHDIETDQLATIIAGLVKQGLTFDCRPDWTTSGCHWTITLTGGF